MPQLQSDRPGKNRLLGRQRKTAIAPGPVHDVQPTLQVWGAGFWRGGVAKKSGYLTEKKIAGLSVATSVSGALLGILVAQLIAAAGPLWIWSAAGSLITSSVACLILLRPRFGWIQRLS